MRTYTDVINELKANGINSGLRGEFYEYEDFPMDAFFEMFFLFCQELLDRNDLNVPIKPARIYYNTNVDPNAVAYKDKGFYLIEFYKGLILQLAIDIKKAKESIKNSHLNYFDDFLGKMNGDFESVFVSFLTSFICYHEIGHLAQNALGDANFAEEFSSNCPPESVKVQHAREQDADWYAANNMVFHIVSLAEQKIGVTHNKYFKFVGDATSMFFATIIWFFLYRKDCGALYYHENSHPHPVIRLTYTIENFIHTIKQYGFNLNYDKAIGNGIKMARDLALTTCVNFPEIYHENEEPIKQYIVDLMNFSRNYQYQSRLFLV